MFWGLIMEPNKRYTQVVEKPFHISQAAMDISTGDNDPCQVMVVVDGKNFLVCTLQKNKCIQVPLDLYFKTGDSVSFLTNGQCNVHLTGYLDPEFEDEPSDEEEEEASDEEVPALVPAKNKRKLENEKEPASKKAKKDKKAAAPAAESSDDDDDEEENQLQKFLDGEEIETDDNDDESFKVNTSTEADDSDEEDSDEDEEDEDEDEDDKDNKEESTEEAETTLDTSQDDKVDMSKLSKSQRRRLKKKLQQQQKQGQQPQVNGVDKAKKEKQDGQQQKAEKKKPEAKKEQKADDQQADKKEKKLLSGGVQIEDLKVGNGPVAKPGKVVMVYYEGRLKHNNKMFDNCVKGPGFKFRLGSKEVITGWDVGIAGMKVGGKRKIICPPSMAYGAKGSPPVIPPNSTLVFDVELKNIK